MDDRAPVLTCKLASWQSLIEQFLQFFQRSTARLRDAEVDKDDSNEGGPDPDEPKFGSAGRATV